MAGKGNDVFTIDQQKWDAATWKKVLMLEEPKWGIDVPSCRIQGHSPPFGSLILFFFRKSTTRSYYLMKFSQSSRVRLFCYDASNLNICLPLCPVLSSVFSSSNQLQCGASRGHL